jgi:hypothetical protein
VPQKKETTSTPAPNSSILLKIGPHFISRKEIRSYSRFGKGCKIMLTSGKELVVTISYEKIAGLLK